MTIFYRRRGRAKRAAHKTFEAWRATHGYTIDEGYAALAKLLRVPVWRAHFGAMTVPEVLESVRAMQEDMLKATEHA